MSPGLARVFRVCHAKGHTPVLVEDEKRYGQRRRENNRSVRRSLPSHSYPKRHRRVVTFLLNCRGVFPPLARAIVAR